MIALSPHELAELRPWFAAQPLGPRRLLGQHVLNTGVGTAHADRWPDPSLVVIDVAGNLALLASGTGPIPDAMLPCLQGFLAAPEALDLALRVAFPDLKTWYRVVLHLRGPAPAIEPRRGSVRPLTAADGDLVAGLAADVAWIAKSWGGPDGLSGSGTAWGGFLDGRLVSVSCSFYVGDDEEDLGVVTEPSARGLGLSTATAAGVCRGIVERGRTPSWTTSPDNAGSLAVARKLGFTGAATDQLYVIGAEIPVVA